MDRPSKSRKQDYGVGPWDSVLNQLDATQMDDSTDYGFEWINDEIYDWDSSPQEGFKMSKHQSPKGWSANGATLPDDDGRPIRGNVGRSVRQNSDMSRRVDLGATGETRLDITPDSTGRKMYGGRRHGNIYYPLGPASAFSDEPPPRVNERVLYPITEQLDYAVGNHRPRVERHWTSVADDRILMRQWHDMFGRIRTKWSSNSAFDSLPVASNTSRAQSFPEKEDNYDKRPRLLRLAIIGGAVCVVLLVAVLVPVILLTGSKGKETEEEVFLKYEYEVTISNRNYSEDMANTSSEAFTTVAEEFCDLLDRNAEIEANEEFTYQGCAVTEITQGSLVIRYTLIILSVTPPTADQVSNVVGITITGDQVDVGDFTVSQIVTISAAVVISEENNPLQKKIPFNTTCGVSIQERCLTKYSECIVNVCSCPVDRYHDNVTDECTLVDCGAVPLIENGTVTASGSRYGSVLYITCDHGYELSDNATVNCSSHGSWGLPSCEPVSCQEFIKPNYSNVDANTTGRVFEDLIEITCSEGYVLDSNTSSVICQADKSWSMSPECVPITCDQFPKPQNSMISPSKSQCLYNENISMECNEGYQLVGSETFGCQSNGTWIEIPTCEPIDCEPLPFPEFAVMSERQRQYVYNENVTIVCKDGYKLDRNESVSCQANSSWTDLPSCKPIECKEFIQPVNSDIDFNTTGNKYGDLIEVTCQSGYTLIGEHNLSCNADGSWPAVYCTKINCTDDLVQPKNSIVIAWNESTSTYEIGCKDGYNIVGNSSVTCLNDAKWSSSPTCEARDCGHPSEIPNAGPIYINSTTFKSRFSVECNEGYYSLDTLIVTCQSNGTWSKFPNCDQVSCGNFTVPEFTIVIVEEGNTYGKKVIFECMEGYELDGNSEIVCQQNGSWTSYPVCQIKDCGQISEISDGIVLNETGTTFGSKVHIKCNEGFVIVGKDVVTCLSTGWWGTLPSCLETDCGNYSPPEHTYVGPNKTLTCDIGYEIIQNDTVECIGGNWSDIEGCKPVECNSFPIIHNANTSKTQERHYVFGDLVEILCNDGFEITGSSEAKCGANRTWENVPTCDIIICQDFLVPHNAVIGEQETKNRVFEDEILVKCKNGYSLTGNDRTICGANKEWLNIPTCNPINCSQLEIPNSDQSDNVQYKYNDTVTVICISGYVLQGVDTIRCNENGTWIIKPSCIQKRCRVPNIPNATLLPYTSEYMYNESITVMCNSGYVLEGVQNITCLENGEWKDMPKCNPVPCSQLDIPNASLDLGRSQFTYNDSVSVACNIGYLLAGSDKLTCLENGSWTDMPTCNPVPCGQLDIPNASLDPAQTQFMYNDSVKVMCNSGYTLAGNDTLKCLDNGSWTDVPTCNPVQCGQLDIPNASLDPVQTQFRYNDSVRVACNNGYTLAANDTLKCLENGSWTDVPTCNPVQCRQLDIPNASFDMDQSEFRYNDSVRVVCSGGYTLAGSDTLKCLENGSWTDMPTCYPVSCGQLDIPSASLDPDQTQFRYNVSVRITCNSGYTLAGNDTLTCLENGSWADVPTCNPVQCGQFDIPNASLDPDQTQFRYNDSVRVTCNSGYTLAGSDTLKCLENGSWEDLPTCNRIQCGKLDIPNALLIPDQTQFRYNDSVSVACNSGYTLVGSDTVKCLENGSWTDVPTCNPVQCVQLDIPNASLDQDQTQFRYNDSVSVACNSGYTLVGGDTLKCLANGSWTDVPTCNPVQCFQLDIPNASLDPDQTQFRYNDSVSVACYSGYTLVGSDTVKCLENGSWTDVPTCNPVQCVQFDIPNASLEPVQTLFRYNDSVRVACNSGYKLTGNDTLRCLENGSWADVPTCNPIHCGKLDIPNVLLDPEQTQFIYNDSVSVACNSGYTLVGSDTLKCLENGSWTGVPTCNPIHCGKLDITNALLDPDQTQFRYNDSVSVACNSGYTLVGSDTVKCLQNGLWTVVPTCNPVQCVQLDIPNASLNPDQTQSRYNDSVSVACNSGYTLVGSDTVKCLENGSWTDVPTCNPVQCVQLDIPNASLEQDQTQFRYNDSVSVACNSGYTLFGSDTLKCLENGSWTDVPTCNPVQCVQLDIRNASLDPDQTQFRYNDTVSVACHSGYTLVGSDTLKCLENGSWTDVPTCNPVQCVQLDIPNASLDPDQAQFRYNDYISVACNSGYTLVGNDSLTCLKNGSWTGVPTCNLAQCGQPDIPNASLDPDQTPFRYNDSVSVACNSGYTLAGSDTLKCLENGSWTGVPTCNPIHCGKLDITNALLDPDQTQFRYNDSVSVACNSGYTLVGSDTVKCLENGSWTDVPTCNPVQCVQLDIRNASLDQDQTQFRYNDSVSIACNSGYTLVGSDTVKCLENGSWTDVPTCNPVQCVQLDIPNASLDQDQTQFRYNDSVSFACNSGYTLVGSDTVRCLENESWTDVPTCNPVQCVQLDIPNASFDRVQTLFRYNDSVRVACNSGYKLTGNDTLKCLENGSWTAVPTCNPVQCGKLDIPNVLLDPDQTKFIYNDSVSVACNSGYTLAGSDTLKCLENGSWTGVPTCYPVQCDELNIPNALLDPVQTLLRYNDSVRVACNSGYNLAGNDTLRCLENGSWADMPTCNPIHCSKLDITNALLDPDQTQFRYNDSVSVSCNSGYTLVGSDTVKCLENGSWTDVPTCNPVQCVQLDIPNASLDPDQTKFKYNDSVSVACNSGYTLVGSDTVKCLENGSWTDVPTCKPVQCVQLDIPNASLDPDQIQFRYNDSVSVACNSGYTLVGSYTLKCLENGSWTDVPTCNPVQCVQLDIRNASLDPDQTQFRYNDSVSVACHSGYTLVGSDTVKCLENGSWTDVPTCNPVQCVQLDIPNASLDPDQTQFRYNDSVSVACNSGYTLVGSDTVKCLENGSWTDVPTCNPVQCVQLDIRNASLDPDQTQFRYNDSVSVACHSGYTLVGSDTVKCLENGSWTDVPTCNPVQCVQLDIPNASLDQDQTKFKYNDSVSVACNSGYTLVGSDTVKCLENGSWTDVPTCKPVQCVQLDIPNASLDPDQIQFRYNDSVSVACNSGYTLVGSYTLKCLENGSWTDVPTCNPVQCVQLDIRNASLDPDQTQFRYNDFINVTCNSGYTLVGSDTVKCLENGSWTDVPTCNPVQCVELDIPNASLDPDQTQFRYNDSVSVACNSGYTLVGSDTLKCLENGSWIDVPTCNPVQCVQLDIPNASLDPDQAQFRYNDYISVACNSGYTLVGSDSLTCLENGSWTGVPTCNLVHCGQPDIPNASLDPDQTPFRYNDSVSVACISGYTLAGNGTLKCLENGSWTAVPTCNPVQCRQLDIPNASLDLDQSEFWYNDSVRVACINGYTLAGSDTLKCLDNGSWTDVPTCNSVQCGQLEIPNASLDPVQTVFRYNDSVSVACNSGYKLAGNDTLKCLENGSWEDVPTCNPIHCGKLDIPNALLDPDQTQFRYNDSVSVACNSGYTLVGSDTVKCLENGSWTDVPTCNPVQCVQLDIPNASLDPDQTKFKYNDSVSVACNSGYTLVGSDTVKCLENGSWTDVPTCKPVQCVQLDIPNASLDPDQIQFRYNDSVSVACNSGYTLVGSYTLKCLENGSWTDVPTCNPVQCVQLDIRNASLDPDQTQFRYNDSVSVACHSGYTLVGSDTVKCLENGSWTDVPTCNPVQCVQLDIPNASLDPDQTQFRYNDSVSVACNSGYTLVGSDTVKCLENGSWTDVPTCNPVQCVQLDIRNASLDPDQTQFRYNDSVSVACHSGYTLVGSDTVKCLENGSWTDVPTCNPVQCVQLDIPNASLDQDQTKFKYNDSVSVACNSGYTLVGSDTVKCLENGSWTDVPTCKPVQCVQLDIPNASLDPDQIQFRYNDSVSVACNSGYTLVGSYTLKCLENGSWTDVPTCNPVQCVQLDIRNASLDPDQTQFRYNDFINVTCNSGYTLVGSDTVKCLENGSWTDVPTCNPVQCVELDIPNASLDPDQTQFRYNDSVSVACNSGYTLVGSDTLKCLENGSWIDVPTCNPVQCVQLDIPNASLDPDQAQFRYNDYISVACNSGYTLVGSDSLTCLENGSWTGVPTCNLVHCGQPDIPNASLDPDQTPFRYNDSVSVACISGYTLAGNGTLKCLENGSWTAVPTCNPVQCRQLDIPNASLDLDQSEFWYNDSVRVACINGYTLAGSDTLKCLDNGSWTDVPTCNSVQCGQLEIPNASLDPVQTVFRYNDSVSVACNSGYKLAGNDTLKCLENGSWEDVPTCNPIHCGKLDIPNALLDPDQTQFRYNDSVSVACNSGYTLVGSDTVKCLENGSWTDVPTCNPVQCVQLDIRNASLDPDQTQFRYNDSVSVACHSGYTLVGSDTVKCLENGSWTDVPTCNPVQCVQLDIPNASLDPDQTQFRYNDSVSVACNSGYTIVGSDTLKCLENGSWIDVPTCNPVQCVQLDIPNASLDPDQAQFRYNDYISVACNSRYTLIGNDSLTCLENGSWTGVPTCNLVHCGQPDIPNASLDPDQTPFRYNDSVSVACISGYTLAGNGTLKCLENGSWTAVPTCNPVQCRKLDIPNASLDPDQTQFRYNDSVRVACINGYTLAGNDTLKCLDNGSWTDVPTCNSVQCGQLDIPNASLDPDQTQFRFNDPVSVACNSGYTLAGNDTLKCLENGSWTDVPTCNPVHCGKLDIPNASLDPDQTQFKYMETVRVTCNSGYMLEGNDTVSCFENGSWINIPKCTLILCDFLSIDHANVALEKRNLTYSDYVTVQCMEGFQLEGDEVISCNENGTWINSPMCIPVHCEQYSIENAEVIPNKTDYSYNENVTIRCANGYTLEGNEKVYCAGNRTWVGVSLCKPIKCELLNLPENAVFLTKQETYVYKENVTLECREGYELMGSGTVSCQADTYWTELPICKPITCEPFQLPDSNETVTNYTGLTLEDELSISCNIGFILVGYKNIRCNTNGTWPDLKCVEVNCSTDDISKLENSVILDVNETVPSFEINCTEGYQIVGNSTVSCFAGNWSEIPTCEIVNCGIYVSTSNSYVVDSYAVTTYNSSMNVTCIAGLEFTNDSARVITCGANGQWNGVPVCNITGIVSFAKDVYSLIEGEEESFVCDVTDYPSWQTVIIAKLDIMNPSSYIPVARISRGNESVINETLDDNYISEASLKTDGVSVTVTFKETICDDEGVYICAAVVGSFSDPIEMKQVRTKVSFYCPNGCREYITNGQFNLVRPNETTPVNTSVPVKCIDGLDFTNDSTTYLTCGADRQWVGQPECKIPGKVSFTQNAYSFEVGDTGLIICEVTNYSSWLQVVVAKLIDLINVQGSPIASVTKENGTFPSPYIFDNSYTVNVTAHEDGVTVSVILNPSACTYEGIYTCAAIVGDVENPIDILYTRTNVNVTTCT